ncbi:MAG TPA: NAD(+) diphosphatase [Candidatus Omnitrophota bacterium]|nr:NAD(+) diphosphatase [Candidatus Omnitrophota bacterium]
MYNVPMENAFMTFKRSALQPAHCSEGAYYLCFRGEELLVEKNTGGIVFPFLTERETKGLALTDTRLIGSLDEKPCFCAAAAGRAVSDGYEWAGLRDVYLNAERPLSELAGYARQILDWNRNFRFCGRCGGETAALNTEHARVCEPCGLISYPRISPAVIVAVLKGDQILLARSSKYSDPQMYSVLAGFLEPGESLEECARREILEEAGIEVGNIQYFKSQSWPFPDCLMIGFTAEYQSGDLQVDGEEIVEAGWFKADALPKVPTRRSISSELIRWFCQTRAQGPHPGR